MIGKQKKALGTMNMENKIPTAEEFLKRENLPTDILSGDDINYAMIEFAKLHVEAALKEASEIVDMEVEKDFLTKDVILNAYPPTNIK